MAESIGLRAVLDLRNFNKGLGAYNKGIGQMSKGTSNFASTAGRQLGNLGTSLLKVGTIAGGAALAGVTALGAGLAGFAVSGISQAKDLDQQMANIAAVMGKTKDEVEPLKDLILELSINPNLKVSATEAADAVELLARNGVDATEIIDGMAESTVALANATGADFGVAADLATDVMALFSGQGVTMQQAIDGITGVTTNSKFSIDDYADAMANMGGAASGLGLDFRQVNTLLAETAFTFKSGGEAGTALRNIFLRLSNPTGEMAAEMESLGLSLFNTDGSMKDIGEVATDLGKILQGQATITQTVGGVTTEMANAAESASKKLPALNNTIEEQQANLAILQNELGAVTDMYGEGSPAVEKHKVKILTLSNSLEENITKQQEMQKAISAVENAETKVIETTRELTQQEKARLEGLLGGTRGVNALVAISKIQGEEFDELTDKINAEGQAMQAAATRVDSLQGAMEILKSIIQGVQIQVGDVFLPVLKDMVGRFAELATSVGPRVVGFFQSILDGAMNLFSVFQTGGTSGLIDALGITPEATQLFDKIVASATELGQAIMSFLLPGLSSLSGGGILDAINAAIIFLNENFETFKGAIIGVGAVLAGGIFIALAGAILSILTPINLIIAAAALLGAAWAGNWGNIQGITMSVVSTIQGVIMTLVNTFTGLVLPQIQAVITNLTTALNNMGLNWGDVWNAIVTAVQIAGAAIGFVFVAAITAIGGFVTGIATGLAVATSFFDAFGAAFTTIIEGVATAFVGWIDLFNAIIAGDWAAGWEAFKLIAEGAFLVFAGALQLVATTVEAIFATIIGVVAGFVLGVIDVFTGLSDTLIGNSIIPDMIQAILDAFTGMVDGVLSIIGGITETIGGIFSSLFGGGEEQGPGVTFDPATMQAGLDAVQASIAQVDLALNNIITVTIPLLNETFIVVTTLMLEQLTVLLTIGIMPVDLALVTIATVTLPLLQTTMVAVSAASVAALASVQAILEVLLSLVERLTALMIQFGQAAIKAGEDAAKGFEKASSKAEKFELKLKKLASTARDLATALADAAAQATDLGNAASGAGFSGGAGFQQGMGFQAGLGANTNGLLGLGFRVPPGFPNDTFGPFFTQSGEEMLITPRGTSIEGLIFSRLANLLRGTSVQGGNITNNNIQNNFNLQVQTTSSARGTVRQFNVMRGFVGT